MVCRVPIGFAKDFCKSAAMSSNPQRFAQVVLRAFQARKLFRVEDVRAAGGPSTTWMTGLRKVASGEIPTFQNPDGRPTEPRGDVFDKIEKAAGWERGAARDLWLLGLEPTQAADATPAVTPDDLAERVRRLEQRVADLEVRIDRQGVRS